MSESWYHAFAVPAGPDDSISVAFELPVRSPESVVPLSRHWTALATTASKTGRTGTADRLSTDLRSIVMDEYGMN